MFILNLRRTASTVVLGLVTLASGCASMMGNPEFHCNGLPEKSPCMSARDSYFASSQESQADAKSPNVASVTTTTTMPVDADVEEEDFHTVVERKVDEYVLPKMPNKPQPIRTPAKVMRIFIAPYEDTAGDLVVSSYVFTEIETRKWLYENTTTPDYQALKVLQAMPPSQTAEVKEEEKSPDISGIMEAAQDKLKAVHP